MSTDSRRRRARRLPLAGITLGDLLDLPALDGARLEPADADLALRLKSVSLGGDDAQDALLLVDGPSPSGDVPGCLACLARTSDPASPVPVVVLPPDASWARVISEIGSAIEDRVEPAAAEAARTAFRRPVLEGRGFEGLVAEAEETLGHPVVCLDEYLDVLAASSGLDEFREQTLREAILRARDHGPASVLGPFLEDELSEVVRRPIADGRQALGVVVAWIQDPPTLLQESILRELSLEAVNELARLGLRNETEAQLRGDFLEELSSAPGLPRESVIRRARHLGTDVAHGAIAVFGTLQDPHDAGRLITDPRLTRRFLQRAGSVLEMNWPGSLVDWDAGRVHLILPARGGADESELEESAAAFAERLLAATRETVPGVALTLALSRFTPEPERLGAAVEEARLAHSIGERLGRVGEVVTFEETGVYKLLFRVLAEHPAELSRFYEQTIAGLIDYDAQRQTDLVPTLATYLDNDGNLAATAAQLFTHRHTVRYRLDRIADLSGLDISRSDDREMLSLGLKAMRLLGHGMPDLQAAAAEEAG